MEKDQIEKLKEMQKYLDYLVGDLALKRSYYYANEVMGAISCVNNITSSYMHPKERG